MRKLLLILSSVLASGLLAQPFTNLALEGGGVRGIAYAGALQVLDSAGALKHVRHVAGTSAGAIHAMLLCCGYSVTETSELIRNLRFEAFNDGGYLFIGGSYRLGRDFGYYRGQTLNDYLGELLRAKTGNADITLKALDSLAVRDSAYKHLYVVASDLTYQEPVVLSAQTMPRMRVRDAVRASCSIPFYFSPVIVDDQGRVTDRHQDSSGWHMLVDGGLLANYPFFVFDSMPGKTLGMRLAKPDRAGYVHSGGTGLSRFQINSLYDFTEACYTAVLDHQFNHFSPEVLKYQTVTISVGDIGPRIRRMKKREVETLVSNGEKAARVFLKLQNEARSSAK